MDGRSRIIVATAVSNSASDTGQLKPALDTVKDNLGAHPRRALADAGDRSEANLQMLEQTRIDGYVAGGREKNLDQATLPPAGTAVGRMLRKLKTKRGHDRYRASKHMVEPPFAWIKPVPAHRKRRPHRFRLPRTCNRCSR